MRLFYMLTWLGLATLSLTALAESDKPATPIVFVEKAEVKEISELLVYPARVSAKAIAPVVSETEGVVTAVKVRLGQFVKKGDPLFVVENDDPAFKYAPVAVNALMAGMIGSVDASEGSRVQKGTKLAQVTDVSTIKIITEIPAVDLFLVSSGMEGSFAPVSTDQPISAKIIGISPLVDPGTGTASCELQVLNRGGSKLYAGMLGRITFKTKSRQGLEISEQAIVYKGKNLLVRTVAGSKVNYVPISVGRRQNGMVEVLSGVKEGALVVTRSSAYVADGESVVVQNPEVARK